MRRTFILLLLITATAAGAARKKSDMAVHLGLEFGPMVASHTFTEEIGVNRIDETFSQVHMPVGLFIGILPERGFGLQTSLAYNPFLSGNYEKDHDLEGKSFATYGNATQNMVALEVLPAYNFGGIMLAVGGFAQFAGNMQNGGNEIANTAFTNMGIAVKLGYSIEFGSFSIRPNASVGFGVMQTGDAVNNRKDVAINDKGGDFDSGGSYWKFTLAAVYQVY